jgi:hypothetical protein
MKEQDKYTPLKPCDNEEDFFHEISHIIMKQYEKEKIITPLYKDHIYEKRSPIIVFINVSVPYNDIFDYNEFSKWFIKTNFKYTFYKHVKPHNPITLYVDNIFINQYFISNDISEKIISTSASNNFINNIINYISFFILSFFYDKTKKVYITAQFILREPMKLNSIFDK